MSGLFYGGLHLIVWKRGFRGYREEMLWKTSCLFLMVSGMVRSVVRSRLRPRAYRTEGRQGNIPLYYGFPLICAVTLSAAFTLWLLAILMFFVN